MAPVRKPAAARPDDAPQTQRDRQLEALLDFRARRLQRRLDDLERTNPTDIPASSFVPAVSNVASPAPLTPTAAAPPPVVKKKQTGNVRKILYAKKSLKDWLDELPSEPRPPYLDAGAPEPAVPPRKLCSSCGYFGKYACPRCGEYSCDTVCLDVHARDGGCGVGQ
ncbi:hypothetical protein DB88DRAFT_502072 [Papiliotrema laurentii]|uniref:HIT-type domain-containing protein n=1 Tax=Papiliotrema laurentii TaxID=5418 RepID=A0AAD9CSG6_PAPLA|nr:hypothetical protein DB88DRAFT_502072 [Papiliotrema laurentii]